MNTVFSITLLIFFMGMSALSTGDNLKAFPPAEQGMVRHVLQLPEQKDESICKVELLVGRTLEVDDGNRHFFGGKIDEETIAGWGFTRYVVHQLGPLASTRMAVDLTAPKVQRFVTIGGEPYLIRYNSRLPVVIYLPEGVEVRYRIWGATTEAKEIDPD